jgi:hypothetical protein
MRSTPPLSALAGLGHVPPMSLDEHSHAHDPTRDKTPAEIEALRQQEVETMRRAFERNQMLRLEEEREEVCCSTTRCSMLSASC